MRKIWEKICLIGTHISVGLILALFILVPLGFAIALVKLILVMLGVI